MEESAAILFGAGATRALGGPMTDEILPHILGASGCGLCKSTRPDRATHGSDENKDAYSIADGFLQAAFNVPRKSTRREPDDYPSLPLLMTLLDHGVVTGEPIGRAADQTVSLERVRHALLTIIYDAIVQHEAGDLADRIERVLNPNANPYWLALRKVLRDLGEPDTHAALYDALRSGRIVTLTTNYDTYLENTLFALQAAAEKEMLPPHFGCKPNYEDSLPADHFKRDEPTFGHVWKLHGSMAWAFCGDCGLLHDRFTPIGKEVLRTLKERDCPTNIEPEATDADTFLLPEKQKDVGRKQKRNHRSPGCAECGAPLSPFMVAPSLLKNYRNDHLGRVWARAVAGLRRSDRWYFVGYSLPDDDYQIARLLLRAARHRSASSAKRNVIVVQKAPAADGVGSRFRRLLGKPTVFSEGCEKWAETAVKLRLPSRLPRKAPDDEEPPQGQGGAPINFVDGLAAGAGDDDTDTRQV